MGTNVTSAGNPGDGRPVSKDVTPSFETFYHGTSPRLLRFAYGLTGDMAQAEDFTQEAYTRAWQRWKRLQTYDNPESWLRLVVTRLATDRWRWLGVRRAAPEKRADVVPGPNETLTDLKAELKRLPMEQRRALVLHYFLDQPVAVIAEETGTNINTVKSWLARGRANLAAQITDLPSLPPAKAVARRGKRRRIVQTLSAFLAAATATAAAFLFAPSAIQPPVEPLPIVSYGTVGGQASVAVAGQRAFTLWQTSDQQAMLSAIDLTTETQAWPPVAVGSFSNSVRFGRVTGEVVILVGVHGSEQPITHGVAAVDPATGKVLWQRPSLPENNVPRIFDDAIVIAGPQGMEALDPRTGLQLWSAAESAASLRFPLRDWPEGNRVLSLVQGGVLRVRDAATGQLLSERTGVSPKFLASHLLIDDWLYLSDGDGLERVQTTGSEPPTQIVGEFHGLPEVCGSQLCAVGMKGMVMFDRQSGQVIWRRPAGDVMGMQMSTTGILVLQQGVVNFGPGMPTPYLIYDFAGNDITPAGLKGHRTSWLDADHLLQSTSYSGNGASGYVVFEELTVFSWQTGKETPLAKAALRGFCASAPGQYICPGDKGFVIFRY